MKNVTISMEEETLAWVRVEAAKAGVSVSRWIASQIAHLHADDVEKAAARERIKAFLANGPLFDLSDNGRISIDRDEMHDGGRFRRFSDPALHEGSSGSGEAVPIRGVAEPPSGYEPDRR